MSASEFQIANVDYIAIGDVTSDVNEEMREFIGKHRRRLVITDTHGGCFSVILTGSISGLTLHSCKDKDIDYTVTNEMIKHHRPLEEKVNE